MLEKLKYLSIDEILQNYDLPHRLITYFASQCAKSVIEHIKDPRSLKAIEIAERFGNGEDFTQEYLKEIHASAASASASASAYAYASSSAASASASSASAAYAAAAAAAASAAYAYSRTKHEKYLHSLLLNIIDTRLTKLEKVLILNK